MEYLEIRVEIPAHYRSNSSTIYKVYTPSYFCHTYNRAWLTELTWQKCEKLSRRSIGIFDWTNSLYWSGNGKT
jgi:hypothetical protein